MLMGESASTRRFLLLLTEVYLDVTDVDFGISR